MENIALKKADFEDKFAEKLKLNQNISAKTTTSGKTCFSGKNTQYCKKAERTNFSWHQSESQLESWFRSHKNENLENVSK